MRFHNSWLENTRFLNPIGTFYNSRTALNVSENGKSLFAKLYRKQAFY